MSDELPPLLLFFNCYLAVPESTLGDSQGDSLTNPMLITTLVQFQQTPAKHLGFEL